MHTFSIKTITTFWIKRNMDNVQYMTSSFEPRTGYNKW